MTLHSLHWVDPLWHGVFFIFEGKSWVYESSHKLFRFWGKKGYFMFIFMFYPCQKQKLIHIYHSRNRNKNTNLCFFSSKGRNKTFWLLPKWNWRLQTKRSKRTKCFSPRAAEREVVTSDLVWFRCCVVSSPFNCFQSHPNLRIAFCLWKSSIPVSSFVYVYSQKRAGSGGSGSGWKGKSSNGRGTSAMKQRVCSLLMFMVNSDIEQQISNNKTVCFLFFILFRDPKCRWKIQRASQYQVFTLPVRSPERHCPRVRGKCTSKRPSWWWVSCTFSPAPPRCCDLKTVKK